MGWNIPTRAGAIAAGLVLALSACGGGGGSLDSGGDDGDETSGDETSGDETSGDETSGDFDDLLGELGIDADDLEGLDLEDLEGLDLGDLENLDEGDFGDLGALAEVFGALGLEELIEENADGDVDVELDEDGFSVESEDGSFSIDEDGSFTVTDEDGEETTGDLDLDEDGADLSVEGDDGSIEFNSGSELPEDWPEEVPEPEGVAIQSAMSFSENDETSIVLTGTIESDPESWSEDYGSALENAGFSQESIFKAGSDVTAVYADEALTVAVIAASVGGDTTVSITIAATS